VVRHGIRRVENCRSTLAELPLGGTALGTGINADPRFAPHAIQELNRLTGLAFRRAANAFEAMQNRDAAVELSGALRTIAVGLMKIANDLRLLASGSRTGLNEIELPATQPGSSIMPGKVNPVIAESLLMVCAQVTGYDAAVAWCCAAGNLELNVMMPVIAYDILQSISLLAATSRNFERQCISGIQADRERIEAFIEQSLAMGTALVPEIGYDKAAALVKDAYLSGRPVREVAREKAGVSEERLSYLLDPLRQTGGGS
jgi:fumarate hydratase class II